MNKILLLFSALLFAGLAQGQKQVQAIKKESNGSIYSPLKPADNRPAVFSTKEELDAKVSDKKQGIMALIYENRADDAKVRYYREELWRFENAIVESPANK
jgi:hypothetical protein